MPAEIPGFYWDEVRNRYFPLSSRPATVSTVSSTSPQDVTVEGRKAEKNGLQKRNLRYIPWHTNLARQSTVSYARGLKDTQWAFCYLVLFDTCRLLTYSFRSDVLCFHYAHTKRVTTERLSTLGSIQAFCVRDENLLVKPIDVNFRMPTSVKQCGVSLAMIKDGCIAISTSVPLDTGLVIGLLIWTYSLRRLYVFWIYWLAQSHVA